MLMGLLGPSTATLAGAPGPLSLHVQTPAFDLNEQGVRVPGYAWNDAPGAPRLPMYGTVIELPASGDWRLTHVSHGSRILDARVAVPAALSFIMSDPEPQGKQMQDNGPDQPGEIDKPDPAIYEVNAFYPASPVVTGDVQWQRGRRLLAVRVFPFQYNPVTRELLYHPDIEITVRVQDSGTTAPAQSGDLSMTAPSVIGPAASTGALRIRTDSGGIHRVTYDDLVGAEAPVAEIDPRSLQMTNRDEAVQIQVIDNGDNVFDSRTCYAHWAMKATKRCAIRMAKATKCNPASVSAKRS